MTTQKSTRKRPAEKPAKPYAGFPLFPHATRRWAKKIRGKLHYFGPWSDPDGALQKYLDQRDDLHAGRTPRVKARGLTLADLCNRYLTSKRRRVDSGELSTRTFADAHNACRRLVGFFGRDRLVDDLAADDFELLRAELAKSLGPVALGVEITRIRSVFKYAYDNALVDKPVRYGSGFDKPGKAVVRRVRNGNGPRLFEADEIRRMLDAADVQLRAIILLGCNCGLGNADISRLPFSAVNLDAAWIDYARPKTGIERRCPLWPETIKALGEAIAARPEPKGKQHADRVFLYRTGMPWADPAGNDDRLSKRFRELLQELGLYRRGRGFYCFRHVVETIGGDSRDQVAVDAIMGHSRGDMGSIYRERISDDRLRAVVEHVRKWLFGEEETK